MESKLSTTVKLPPILRLPPEIRLKIYRLLVLSDLSLRMDRPHTFDCRPKYIFPAILSTCHLIHGEAVDVLYRENVFRAHRIDESNINAALITRAKWVIKYGDLDTLGLPKFLHTHPNLNPLKFDFKNCLLDNKEIRDFLSDGLYTSDYSSWLSAPLDFRSAGVLSGEKLERAIEMMVFMRKNYPKCLVKIVGVKKRRRNPGRS